MGTNLSDMGTPATLSPIIKKGTDTLFSQDVIMMVPDLNSASGHGVDTTGVAKVRFYRSNIGRTSYSLALTWTPSVVFCSSTVQAVMSMVVDSGNNMHVVWAGTDNSLNYEYFAYASSVWTATTKQTVVAANAVARRYRAVDIDVCSGTSGSTATIAIAAYEAKTSAGLSAFARLFVRNNDNTTWINAYTEDYTSLSGGALPIKQYSEDVSVSFNTTGVASNVVRLAIGNTRMTSTLDYGDPVRDITYNISTGTSGSATVVGTWQLFNKGMGSPYRRLWLYKIDGSHWQLALVAGVSQPQFSVARLVSGSYASTPVDVVNSAGAQGVIVNINTGTSIQIIKKNFSLYPNANNYTYITTSYCDNQLMFAFLYAGVPSFINNARYSELMAVVFTYAHNTDPHVSRKDSSPRILDNYYLYNSVSPGWAPTGIYGAGNNRNNSGDHQFNFVTTIAVPGSALTWNMEARAVCDTTFNAPTLIAPSTTQPIDTPLLRASFKSTINYPLPQGKMEWQIANDSAFTSNLKDIVDDDSLYRYVGSNSAVAAPLLTIQHLMTGVGVDKLKSGTWYLRCRLLSDLGMPGTWSNTLSFQVLHYPAAIPRYPSAGQIVNANDTPYFAWDFTDPEASDNQTAYWLQVFRTDTNSIVLDTGVVNSVAESASVGTALVAYIDAPLAWQVALLDSDSVTGYFSTLTPFTISNPPSVLLTNPVDGSTEAAAAPSVAWSFNSAESLSQNAFKVNVNALLAGDRFDRVSASGWGTGDTGQPWTNYSGAASNFTTDGTNGYIFVGDIVSAYRAIQDTVVVGDIDFSCTIATNVVSAGGVIAGQAVLHFVDTNNYILAGINYNTDGTFALIVKVLQNGAQLYATSDGGSSAAPHSYTVNTPVQIRCHVEGQRIRLKTWAVGVAEPQAWNIDTGIISGFGLASGSTGFYALQNTGVTNTTTKIAFSSMSVVSAHVTPLASSGWVTSAISFYQFASNVMINNTLYQITVDVQDTHGLQSTARALVLSSWVHGALGAMAVTTQSYGAVITWTNAGQDTDFNSWRVWRRYNKTASGDLDFDSSSTTWVLIYETQDGSASSYSFTDLLAPNQKNIDYVVTQTVDRFGSLLDSNITAYTTVVLPGDRYYFIPDISIGSIASYEASNVTNDTFTDDQEQSVILVVDQGNQVQVGTDKGLTGTLTIQLRNPASARSDREFLTHLAKNGIGCYMKSPFGDVTYIKFSPISVNRIPGVGTSDLVDLSIPYVEVYTTGTPITRTV